MHRSPLPSVAFASPRSLSPSRTQPQIRLPDAAVFHATILASPRSPASAPIVPEHKLSLLPPAFASPRLSPPALHASAPPPFLARPTQQRPDSLADNTDPSAFPISARTQRTATNRNEQKYQKVGRLSSFLRPHLLHMHTLLYLQSLHLYL